MSHVILAWNTRYDQAGVTVAAPRSQSALERPDAARVQQCFMTNLEKMIGMKQKAEWFSPRGVSNIEPLVCLEITVRQLQCSLGRVRPSQLIVSFDVLLVATNRWLREHGTSRLFQVRPP